MIWFIVRKNKESQGCVITNAMGREGAKLHAQKYLFGDLDDYIVTPLTNEGETVRVNIMVPG